MKTICPRSRANNPEGYENPLFADFHNLRWRVERPRAYASVGKAAEPPPAVEGSFFPKPAKIRVTDFGRLRWAIEAPRAGAREAKQAAGLRAAFEH